MTFPGVPGIDPNINLDREDAIVLLLISIALEEMSLSELINAENDKIKYVAEKYSCGESSIQDLKDINRSVNQTIKDIVKLQVLFQLKLESVLEAVCPNTLTSTETISTTTTTTTTTTSTTTSTTSFTTTTTKKKGKWEFGLMGQGSGILPR